MSSTHVCVTSFTNTKVHAMQITQDYPSYKYFIYKYHSTQILLINGFSNLLYFQKSFFKTSRANSEIKEKYYIKNQICAAFEFGHANLSSLQTNHFKE